MEPFSGVGRVWVDGPCQANGDDGGRSHPTLSIESIREPIPEHGPSRPCPTLHGGNIAVNVGPEKCMSDSGPGDGCRRTYQAPGSANDVSGRGRTHPALVVLDLRSALM